MLSRLVIAFLPRSKHPLISWLQSPSAVILEPRPHTRAKKMSLIVSTVSPYICHEVMGLDPMILVFRMLNFKPTFSLSSFTFIKRPLVLLHFLPQGWCHLCIWGYWYFSWKPWFQLVLHPTQHFAWCTLHRSLVNRVAVYSLDIFLSPFGTSLCSMSGSNCCFLTGLQFSQEAGNMVWYSHLFKNFPVCCDPHSKRI